MRNPRPPRTRLARPIRPRDLAAALVIAILVVPLSAAAQASATPPDTSEWVVDLPAVVVTASRLPGRADQLGLAVSVVSATDLAVDRPLYAVDALRGLAGTFIDEAAGPGGPTIARLRGGEEVFTQILLDGVQVNQNGGFFDFQGFTLNNVERIEVARGPQSALYGSSAVSGVIQFITARGTPGPLTLAVQGEGGGDTGNGGSFQAGATGRGGSQRVQYSAGAGVTYNRGIYRIAHDTWTRDASLRVDVDTGDRWDLTGNFRYVGIESNLPVRDAGATRVPLDPNARDERDRFVGSIVAAFAPSATWSHSLTASTYREDFVFEDERDDVAEDADYPFFIFDADFLLDSRLWRSNVQYVGSYSGASDSSLSVAFGGLVEREDLEDRTDGEFGAGTLGLARNNVAGFAEARLRPTDRVGVLVGTRLEKYENMDAEFTPRASVFLDVRPGVLSLRAAAGQAYKVPNLQQQFLDNPFIASNPDLEPERSTSYEVGADLSLADRRFVASLTYFQQDYENLIRSVGQENSDQQINRNLGESQASGLEWDVRYRASRAWLLGSDGSVADTEILENSGLSEAEFPIGGALPFRPDFVGSAYVELLPTGPAGSMGSMGRTGRFSGRLRGTFVGGQTVLSERFSGERIELDGYVLVGLTLGYAHTDRTELFLRVSNLFDTEYETAFDRTGIPLTAALGFKLSR